MMRKPLHDFTHGEHAVTSGAARNFVGGGQYLFVNVHRSHTSFVRIYNMNILIIKLYLLRLGGVRSC
jgi:hypothetical protein